MSKRTQHINRKTKVVYLLLLVLLSLRVGGAVSHYCFDGMEPLLTVHFDNLNGHVAHADESGHVDAERQALTENLQSKLFDFELTLAIVALFFLGLPVSTEARHCSAPLVRNFAVATKLLPPLRAPPLSC